MMELAASFADIFTGFSRRFGQYTVREINETKNKHEGRATTLDRPPTIEDYQNHINGVQRMGVVPLMDDGTSVRFAAIDIDLYPKEGENKDELIDAIVKAIGDRPLFVTRSKSGGAHIWMFAKDPIPATRAYKAMKELAGELGYGNAEIFPKQTIRNDPDDTGNWINIPFYGTACQGRMMDTDGKFDDVNLADFVAMVEQVDQDMLESWLNSSDYNPLDAVFAKEEPTTEDFEDGPPCLKAILKQFIVDGSVPQGGRNDLMFDIGLYYKKKYETAERIEQKLNALDSGNAHIGGKAIPAFGLGPKEIKTTHLKTLLKKDYHYRCNRSPLSDNCKARECRKKAFGIEGHDESILPDSITIYRYSPTEADYYLSLSKHGVRLGPFKSGQIMTFKKYQQAVTEVIDSIPPKMDDGSWVKWINALFASARKNVVHIRKAGSADRFAQRLADWVRNAKTWNLDLIADGRPYLLNGELKFRIQDLLARLRMDGTVMDAQVVYDLIRRIDPDARVDTIKVDGASIDIWIVNVKDNEMFNQETITKSTKGAVDDVPF